MVLLTLLKILKCSDLRPRDLSECIFEVHLELNKILVKLFRVKVLWCTPQ